MIGLLAAKFECLVLDCYLIIYFMGSDTRLSEGQEAKSSDISNLQ